MRRNIRTFLGHNRISAVVIAITTVALVLGGVALAQTGDGTQFTGCLKNGDIFNIALGSEPTDPCKSGETEVSWNSEGRPGATWFSGPDTPDNSLGSNGDLYLHLSSGDVFVKESETWLTQANLTGPQGPQGPQGPEGPQGPQGEPGEDFTGASAGGDLTGTYPNPLIANDAVGLENFEDDIIPTAKAFINLQSVPGDGTRVVLTPLLRDFDSADMLSSVSPERIFAPVNGIYLACGELNWQGGTLVAGSHLELVVQEVLSDGTPSVFVTRQVDPQIQDPSVSNFQSACGLARLDAGESVQLAASHNVGTSQMVGGTLSLQLVSPGLALVGG